MIAVALLIVALHHLPSHPVVPKVSVLHAPQGNGLSNSHPRRDPTHPFSLADLTVSL